ncbi:hypothetical protein L4D79_24505 [Photobacterium satsumensis]
MMKQYKRLLCGWILALGLTACGGGGGDSASSGSSPSDDGGNSEEESVTMATIKVAPDYDFTTSKQLEVDVDLSSLTDKRAYIGFYQQWNGDDNSPIPNPDTQLLLFITDDGQLNQTLTLGKQQQSLMMLVMFTDTSIPPIAKVFALGDGKELQYP